VPRVGGDESVHEQKRRRPLGDAATRTALRYRRCWDTCEHEEHDCGAHDKAGRGRLLEPGVKHEQCEEHGEQKDEGRAQPLVAKPPLEGCSQLDHPQKMVLAGA
jgi:hypothetical protein